MSKAPIDMFLDENAVWIENPPQETSDGIPYATHSGVWEFQGMKLRVHRLSDGKAIIEEESMLQFLDWLLGAKS